MSERDDLLESLGRARHFLRHTTRDLDDEQATQRTTVSELTLAGLIKHVMLVEGRWVRFIQDGPSVFPDWKDPAARATWVEAFRLQDGETLAGTLDAYAGVAASTDELIRSLPDLDADQPLPDAPWHPPGTRWTARRVVLHLIAETAQHAGHADILREALDGAKTMG